MSDNSNNSFTDRYSTKRASQAWEEASSPIVRFRTDDGACWGFIFHHLEYARFERDTLLLEWSIGTIRIRGPKMDVFFDKFANHEATSISADGKDIESVAIEKLTDADLNITMSLMSEGSKDAVWRAWTSTSSSRCRLLAVKRVVRVSACIEGVERVAVVIVKG